MANKTTIEAFAKLIAERPDFVDDEHIGFWLCNELGRILDTENPRFDWTKWQKACTKKSESLS